MQLYPANSRPLRAEDFENPGAVYRGAPFWAWNTKLDPEELTRQIAVLKKMGYGGFHMHVRTGLETAYLSDAYKTAVKACVEKARDEGMLSWAYDEDRWPSGAAGGLVTKNENYRQRFLKFTRRKENGSGVLLASFEIRLNPDGTLESYKRVSPEAAGKVWHAFLEIAKPDSWYNNQTYIDALNEKAVRVFLDITHEWYKKHFSADFGGTIPAIFTDEPQFSRKETLKFANDDADVRLPWTDDLPLTYKKTYNEDLIDGIPEIIWDLPNGKPSLIRYHYHDHVTERFTQAFSDQVGAWCEENGIALAGHMDEEPTLLSQTHAIGEAMRAYRGFQLPGIDMLCDRREFTTAKQAQSAARQFGRPGVLSELYGVTNWDFDFRGHKLQGDWQAALGVTVRVPHLSWVTMAGEAKRDYPGTFNYQAPWHEEYPFIEDHFARVNTALTRGRPVCRIAVVHPIESYWLHWGPSENTEAVRAEMDARFVSLCDWLTRSPFDFDYISESTLPQLTPNLNIIKNPLSVGEARYSVVIIPAMETMRRTTLNILRAFRERGGRVVVLDSPPKFVDAEKADDAALSFFASCETCAFDKLSVAAALSAYRDIEIRYASGEKSGAETDGIVYQMREEEEAGGKIRWLFLAHAGVPVNKDIPRGNALRLKVRGAWSAELYDTLGGGISPFPIENKSDWTELRFMFYEHDSLLLKLTALQNAAPETKAPAVLSAGTSAGLDGWVPYLYDGDGTTFFGEKVPVTLSEPNVLLLDIAEYRLNDGEWQPPEEILRADNRIRTELGWALRKKTVAQPWVEQDASTPHKLELRFSFESQFPFEGAELALENAGAVNIALNGLPVRAKPCGWYVDRCFEKIALPPLKRGRNEIAVSMPLGKKTNLEAAYLLGAFGVCVEGSRCTLISPVTHLSFGDITRQGLPFYGGNITYHLDARLPDDAANAAPVLSVSSYRGALLAASLDGRRIGRIAYSPYSLALPQMPRGASHKLDLRYFGTRINTFGQLHCNVRDAGFWWGPNAWRTGGAAWTYEYRFWEQGILKSPEIRL